MVILKEAVEMGTCRDQSGSAGVLSTHVDEQSKIKTERKQKDQAEAVSCNQEKQDSRKV